MAEHIRSSVAAHHFDAGFGTHVTCSIGVASFPFDSATRERLIEAADSAMHAAKHMGRNQARLTSNPAA